MASGGILIFCSQKGEGVKPSLGNRSQLTARKRVHANHIENERFNRVQQIFGSGSGPGGLPAHHLASLSDSTTATIEVIEGC